MPLYLVYHNLTLTMAVYVNVCSIKKRFIWPIASSFRLPSLPTSLTSKQKYSYLVMRGVLLPGKQLLITTVASSPPLANVILPSCEAPQKERENIDAACTFCNHVTPYDPINRAPADAMLPIYI